MVSSSASIVYNLTFANGVGDGLKPISKAYAIFRTLPMFACSVAYRAISLAVVVWLFVRWDIEGEKDYFLHYQDRAYKRIALLCLTLFIGALLGLGITNGYILYKHKTFEDDQRFFSASAAFLTWYSSTLICGPVFVSNIPNRFIVFKNYYRFDAILNFLIRSILLITLAVLYKNDAISINDRLCSSHLMKEYFSEICYILLPIGLLHYLLVEATFKINSLLEKVKTLSILAYC